MGGGGVFCANFCYIQVVFKAFLKAWCKICYFIPPLDWLPKGGNIVEEGEEEFEEVVEGEGKTLSERRDGDHLMGIPLQCELCHIRNIEGQNLTSTDKGLMILMRRENLDACWGTEPSTVVGNLGSLRRIGCVVSQMVFIHLALVGTVSSGIFVGNDTRSIGATGVSKIREIQRLFTVVHS